MKRQGLHLMLSNNFLKALLWKKSENLVYGYLRVFLLGLVTALAMPPASVFFVLFFTISGLLFTLDQFQFASKKQIFLLGWYFGWGYFIAGLYWVSFALKIDLARFFWLIPFAVVGLPALMALYTAFTVLFTHLTKTRGLARCMAFSILWAAFEWLRGNLFTGFPWNLLGYSWMNCPSILQSVSVTGIYGLSLITLIISTMPYAYFSSRPSRLTRPFVALITGIFLLITIAGYWRLSGAPFQGNQGEVVRIVQPNIKQDNKWNPLLTRDNFFALINLSKAPSKRAIKYLIWPESATSFFLNESPQALGMIAQHLSPQSMLFTGAPRRQSGVQGETTKIWNSLLVINHKGQVLKSYDKAHLVPFGEYVPFRDYLPSWIGKVTYGALDYSVGEGVRTFTLPNFKSFSPLICYEVIFPGKVISRQDQRPKWLLNITNDGWYGYTSGPFQHAAISQVRAIEEGVPLVRAANTGISMVIDPYGRNIASLGLNEKGVIDASLPEALPHPTLYAQYGNKILFLMFLVLAVFGYGCARLRL